MVNYTKMSMLPKLAKTLSSASVSCLRILYLEFQLICAHSFWGFDSLVDFDAEDSSNSKSFKSIPHERKGKELNPTDSDIMVNIKLEQIYFLFQFNLCLLNECHGQNQFICSIQWNQGG